MSDAFLAFLILTSDLGGISRSSSGPGLWMSDVVLGISSLSLDISLNLSLGISHILSLGDISFILTLDLDTCSFLWTSDLGINGIKGIIVSFIHGDICWCQFSDLGNRLGVS